MSRAPRVTVLIETSTSCGKDTVRGIVDYVRNSSRWLISVSWRGIDEQLHLPRDWRGDGVIARVTSQKLARQLASLRVPAVNVSWSTVPGSKVPRVSTDERVIGRLAAEHFLERGFRQLAYIASADLPYYKDRCGPSFAESVQAAGHWFGQYRLRRPKHKDESQLTWSELAALGRWLQKIPKPVAIFAWDALHGRLVTDACLKLDLRVPEDVSVLVGFSDDLMCEIASPPMSGIDDSPYRVGYEAAKLLDQMMHGAPPPKEPTYIPPAGIVVRRSTDTLALDDPDLKAAISFIRENANKPLSVADVLKKVPLSRRMLEYRFLRELGRTPAEEIRLMHLQRARDLLIKTDLPIAKIAIASGFTHPEVMSRAFQRKLGLSPLAFRKQFRAH